MAVAYKETAIVVLRGGECTPCWLSYIASFILYLLMMINGDDKLWGIDLTGLSEELGQNVA